MDSCGVTFGDSIFLSIDCFSLPPWVLYLNTYGVPVIDWRIGTLRFGLCFGDVLVVLGNSERWGHAGGHSKCNIQNIYRQIIPSD